MDYGQTIQMLAVQTASCEKRPPVGIGYSFIAAPPINIAAQPVDFSMTADSGACSHFIDNQLLPGIEHKMNHYVQLDPPVIINVAGTITFMALVKGFWSYKRWTT